MLVWIPVVLVTQQAAMVCAAHWRIMLLLLLLVLPGAIAVVDTLETLGWWPAAVIHGGDS